jgi:molecular chaperone HtpG
MSPYRSGPHPPDEAASPETSGLISDVVEQFADPRAFYRELIQNAIDAGATVAHVELAWIASPVFSREGSGIARVSVRDDGCGMSQAVIESKLLVLFRSGKEGIEDAIGRFGIGFASVLAVEPELVTVKTCEGSGRTLTVHLRPDFTFDLFETEGGGPRGTVVTLDVPIALGAFATFARESRDAVERWCRHARLAIHFTAVIDDGAPLFAERIDRPLDLDALVQVTASYDEERTTILVGVPNGDDADAGFFNRGLTLWEPSEPFDELGHVAFKVLDPGLGHTLSRDGVRRDRAFARTLRRIREVRDGALAVAAVEALTKAAQAREPTEYARLVVGITQSSVPLHPDVLPVPTLEEPFVVPLGRLPRFRSQEIYTGLEPSALSRALAADGTPVVDLRVITLPALWVLTSLVHASTVAMEERACLITPLDDLGPPGHVITERVWSLLDQVHRAPKELAFVDVEGRGAAIGASSTGASGAAPLAVSVPSLERAHLFRGDDPYDANPFRLLLRPAIGIRRDHPLARAALRRAEVDVEVAAVALARALLIEFEASDEKRDVSIVTAGITRVLGGDA